MSEAHDARLIEILKGAKVENDSAFGPSFDLISSEKLRVAIPEHPVLGPACGKYLRSPSSLSSLSAGHIEWSLARRKLAGADTKTIVRDAVEFFAAPTTDGITVFCLHAVQLDAAVRLTDRISIVRPVDVPDTEYKRVLFSDTRGLDFSLSQMLPRLPPASAAIIYRSSFEPVTSNTEVPAPGFDDLNLVGYAIDALVVAGATAERGCMYSHNLHPGCPYVGYSLGWGGFPDPHVRSKAVISANDIQAAFEQLRAFQNWQELSRLISRLARARKHGDPVDAHLDLGIVAEGLLTHGDQEQGEIGHRLAIRAAWILGKSSASRKEFGMRMRRLYELRSAAAHNGKLPSKGSRKKRPWSQEDRDSAEELCVLLIKDVLRRGKFVTDWPMIIYG